MGKVVLKTDEAVEDVQQLINAISSLKTEINKISSKDAKAFTRMQKSITSLKGAIDKIDPKFKTLNKAIRANNTQMKASNLATKAVATAVNTLTPAIEKNTKALNKGATSIAKSNKEYAKLKRSVEAAKSDLQELTLVFGKNAAKTKKAANTYKKLKNKLDRVDTSIKKTKDAYTKLNLKLGEAKRKMENLIITKGKDNAKTQRAIANYKALNRQLNATVISTKKVTKAKQSMLQTLGRAGGAILALIASAQIFIQVMKNIIRLAVTFDSLTLALKFTSESTWEAGRSMQFLFDLNKKFGASISLTADRWLKFRTAARLSGLTMLETKDIFTSVTKASALLGLRTDELKGIYLALEQMLNKGKVTTEELRRQLGERLPGAVGIMARSMGVGLEELDKMLKAGEVLSAEVLPRFAEELERAYGIDQTEKIENMQTAINKLKGAWEELVLTVVQGDSLFSKALTSSTSAMTIFLNKLTFAFANTEQLVRMFQGTFNKEFSDKYTDDAYGLVKGGKSIQAQEEKLKGLRIQEIRLKEELQSLRDKGAKQGAIDKENEIEEKNKQIRKQEEYVISIDQQMKYERNLQAKINLSDAKEAYENQKAVVELIEGLDGKTGIAANMEDTWAKIKAGGSSIIDFFSGKNSIAGSIMYGTDKGAIVKNMKDLLDSLGDQKTKLIKAAEYLRVTQEFAEQKVGKIKKDEDDSGSSNNRKIKYAKEYVPNNKVMIAQLKEQIRLNNLMNQEQFATEEDNNARRLENEAKFGLIAFLERLDRDAKYQADMIDIKKKADATMTGIEGKSEAFKAKQQEEVNKMKIKAEKEFQDKMKLSMNKYEVDKTKIKENTNMQEIEDASRQVRGEKDLAKAQFSKDVASGQAKIDGSASGTQAEARATLELEKIKTEYYNKMIDFEIKLLEIQLLNENNSREQEAGILKMIEGLEKDKDTMAKFNASLTDGAGAWENWTDEAIKSLNKVAELTGALTELQVRGIDNQIEKTNEYYDNQLERAKNDDEETKIIERNKELRIKELEKRKRDAQLKQAKFEKLIAIASATRNVALAASIALATQQPPASYVTSGISAALAAIELTTVIATPLPKYALGGVSPKDELALINDGGRKEYVERNGRILSTDRENAIVDLKKGDIIHKDYEDMNKKMMLLNGINGGFEITSEGYDNMLLGIEDSIEKGFKKAKINNSITVLNEMDSYRDKMSNWD